MFFHTLLSIAILHGTLVYAKETNCIENEKLFADLCFLPTPTDQFDLDWVKANQPEDGWHVELSNDIFRLHSAELLKGKLLDSIDEDIEKNLCLRVKIEHTDTSNHQDGEYFGFKEQYTNFDCVASKDFFGVQKCKMNSTLSEYHEDYNIYFSYATKSVHVVILCYPNGQVGWHSMAVGNQLTPEQTKQVDEHITSLGFPANTTVTVYDTNICDKK